MPSRAEIDPLELRQCLGWVCLVDVLRERQVPQFRYRVYGSGLVDICGRELTGHYLDEPGGDDGRDMLAIYREAGETSLPLFVLRQRQFRKGTCLLESAVLPLSDNSRFVTGLMDVTVPVESWRVLLGAALAGSG
jgi:hypothetical protein